MFELLINSILKRYSIDELSQKFNLDLPNYDKLYEELHKSNCINSTEGKFIDSLNINSIKKCKGAEKIVFNLYSEGIEITRRLSFFEKLKLRIKKYIDNILFKINDFFDSIKLKLRNFIINSLLRIVPNLNENFKNVIAIIISFIINILLFPFLLLSIISGFINNLSEFTKKYGGGAVGFLIGLLISLILIPIDFIKLLLLMLLNPIIENFLEKMLRNELVKKIVIGKIMQDNIINNIYIVPFRYFEFIEIKENKKIIGSNEKCIILKSIVETSKNVSLKDKLLAFFFNNYYINKYNIIISKDETFIEQLLNILKK